MAMSIVPPSGAAQQEEEEEEEESAGLPCNLWGFEKWGEQEQGGVAEQQEERDRAIVLGSEPAGCGAARRAQRRGEVRAAARRTKRAASPFDPVVVEVVRRALEEFS